MKWLVRKLFVVFWSLWFWCLCWSWAFVIIGVIGRAFDGTFWHWLFWAVFLTVLRFVISWIFPEEIQKEVFRFKGKKRTQE